MKTKFSRRILAFVLAFALVVPMFVFNASAEDGTWTLVTDASELKAGDKVIIAAAKENYALSTESRSNNKGSTEITKSGNTATITDKVQVFTLQEGTLAGSFAFYNGSQYLYSTLNKSNYLKYQNSKNEAASWNISINASSGVATIKAGSGTTGDSYRNWMRFNTSNSPKLFSCYGTGQTDVCIYKLVTDTSAPVVTISGANITTVGSTTTLSAELTNVSGDVAWTSSDTNVATVNGGVVTGVGMGTATITAGVNGTEGKMNIIVYPAAGELTIAEALKVCELTGTDNSPYAYWTTGVITECTYSDKYSNYTVTISDGTDSIVAYGITGDAEIMVGDEITVTGYLVNYSNTTKEFSTGSTFTKIVNDVTEAIRAELNEIAAKMSLAYKYEANFESVVLPSTQTFTDLLDKTFTGVSGTSYTNWSGKTVTNGSGAVYAGNSAGGNSSIQLRSNNSNSGIVTTKSGGKAVKIVVSWNSNTGADRTIDIYGKNTAYSAATDLYGDNKGTKIGSIKKDTTELVINGDYEYIGIRSSNGALYLTSIEIVWESEVEGGGETVTKEVYKNSEFRFRFGVDAAVANIENVDAYGIKVTANGKTAYYTKDDAKSWTTEDGYCFVTVSLGDIINDLAKLETEFTVCAYVKVGDFIYESEQTTKYSVVSIIEHYCDNLGITEVEHLYDYLANNGLI